MVLLESMNIPLGTSMPKFELKDPYGRTIDSKNLYTGNKKGLLVAFTCNHCPYAKAVWPRLIKIGDDAIRRDINAVAINPNIHPDFPEDSPEKMKEAIAHWGIPFPYLVDESQEIAKAFQAQCTPDIFLFNADKKLVYHGRIDDNWKDESAVTQHELKLAVEALINDTDVSANQNPSLGCSIKWK